MQFKPPPQVQASPRAQMLSGDLARAVEDFRKRYPDTADRDVNQALHIVAQAGTPRSAGWAVALLLGVAILFGMGFLTLILGRHSVGGSEVLVVVSAFALIALTSALVANVRRH